MKNSGKTSKTPKSRNIRDLEATKTAKPPKYGLGMTQKSSSQLKSQLKIATKGSRGSLVSSRNGSKLDSAHKTLSKRIPKISPSTNLIYDLKVENKKLKDQNLILKERLSDLSQTLAMNKQMLQDIIDKSTNDLK